MLEQWRVMEVCNARKHLPGCNGTPNVSMNRFGAIRKTSKACRIPRLCLRISELQEFEPILVTILIHIIVTILCNYNIGIQTKKTEQRPWVAQVNWASEPSGHVADSRPGQKRQTLAKLTDWTKSAPGNTDSTIKDHEPQPVRKEIQVLGFELRSIDDFCCLLHPACGR